MESAYSPELTHYILHFGYAGIFLFFITVDQLTPLPEEFTLLALGYFAATHLFNPYLAGLSSIAGFITIDVIYFFLAKSGNKFFTKLYNRLKFSAADKYKEKLKNNLAPTLIILCFIPRMRLWGPVFVGMMNISFRRFILFDSIGLIIFTSVYLSLGMFFHHSIQLYMPKLQQAQHIVFFAVLLFICTAVVMYIRRRRKYTS